MTGRKRLKVVSFYPKFSPSFWSFEYTVQEILRIGATMPPLGLATVLAMLPESFELYPIIDLRFRPLRDEDMARADIVFVSAMIAQKDSLREVVAMARKHNKTVVVGGPYATSSPEEVLDMGVDHIVGGEAEMTLTPFLEDYARGSAKRVYQEKDVIDATLHPLTQSNKPRMDHADTVPLWDLVEVNMYSSLALQYSRGCPFDCEFCDITQLFGRSSRTKTPDQVLEELEAILATGFRGSIFIVDDNFIGNKNGVRKLLEVLTTWQRSHSFPFTFFTEASLNLANPDMTDVLRLMVEAGFEEIFVGIESVDPDALKITNKVQNKGDLSRKVEIIQEAGLVVTAGFIIGLDGDKRGSGKALARFIQSCGIVIPMPGLLTALPGTRLEKRLRDEGRMLGASDGINTHHTDFNFKTILPEEDLVAEYIDLLEGLFSAKNYFERCRVLRRKLGKCAHSQNRVNWQGFMAMLRVFRYYTLHPNLEFFKFMAETLLTPRHFPSAVTQAAKLIHFARLTEQTVRTYRKNG